MKRRDPLPALSTLPGAACAAPVSQARGSADTAQCWTEDPILPLFREWQAARADWCAIAAVTDGEGPDCEAAMHREVSARDAIAALEPTSPEGLSAALHVLWVEIAPGLSSTPGEFDPSAQRPEYRLFWNIGQAVARMTGTMWNPGALYG